MAEEYLTDDEQLEVVKHAFVEYAPWIIGGVLIGAGVFFGIQYYRSYTEGRALKAAAQFSAMTAALQANDHPKSRQIADALVKDFAGSPYADQAQLALARLDVEEGQLGNAIAPLTLVMNGSKDGDLRQVARLRLARVLTGQGKSDEAIKTLSAPIPNAFAAAYHEARGDAYSAEKKSSDALSEYREALAAAVTSGMNGSLLELKIQDLGNVPLPVATAASPDVLNKANP